MKQTDLKMGAAEWGLLLLLSALWGSSFLFMKVAVQSIPVFTVVLGRIGLAAVLLTIYVYLRGLRLPTTRADWQQLAILGFLRAALPISLFVWAGSQIDSNLSGILNSTTPLFTVIIAHFLTEDERINGAKLIGILISMTGVAYLMGFSALQGLGNNIWGQLAVLGATCSYGFAGVYGRKSTRLPVAVSTAGFLITSTIMILPLSIIIDQPWTLRPEWAAIGSVLALATFNTAVAFILWLQLTLRAGATNTSQVTFIIPFISILLGVTVLGEQVGWNTVIGFVLILLGLAVAQKWRAFQMWLSGSGKAEVAN